MHLKLLAEFMTDLWEFIKKWDKTVWNDEICNDCRALAKKYNNDRLAELLILAVINYHDEMLKKEDKGWKLF